MPLTHPTVGVKVKHLHPIWTEHPLAAATPDSAGLDLRAALDMPFLDIPAAERVAVPTGLAIEIEAPGLAGFVFSRSGLGAKQGLTVAQGVGVIDPDYRGEIVVWLLNTSQNHLTITRGERIAQLVILPFARAAITAVDELGGSIRGGGGFGHTGRI